MILVSLKVKNFKKFEHTHESTFLDTNIIIEENGFGKTTIFQAILFALYGERPAGGNLNSFLNNPEKKASVELTYMDGSETYMVSRIIGGTSSLYKATECITTSSKEITAYTESQYPKGVRDILVNYGSLGEKLLKPSIVDELILDKKPQLLAVKYKRELYDLRVIDKKIVADHEKTMATINELVAKSGAKSIEGLQEFLNQSQGVSQVVIDRVNVLRDLKKKNEALSEKKDPYGYLASPNEVMDGGSIATETLNKRLDSAKVIIESQKDLPKRSIPISAHFIDASNEANVCQACEHVLSKPLEKSQDTAAYEKAKKTVESITWALKNSKAILASHSFIEEMKELASLERLYGKALDDALVFENKLSKDELALGSSSLQRLKSLATERKQVIIDGKLVALKRSITDQYINEQRDILSYQIIAHATKVLNTHYASTGFQAVLISDDGTGFSVYRNGSIHPVSLLSSGERTIVNFALIIAVAKIFPTMPVILDEPFGNLDASNKPLSLQVAKEEFKGHQLFLTNH